MIDIFEQKNIDLSKITCHSGGAEGSDTYWETIGEEFGVRTRAYSYKTIDINIYYNYRYDLYNRSITMQLEDLYFRLLEIARHELEHSVQGDMSSNYQTVDIYKSENIFIQYINYMLQNDEKEAIATGFYLESKKTGKRFLEVAKNYISKQLKLYAKNSPGYVVSLKEKYNIIK